LQNDGPFLVAQVGRVVDALDLQGRTCNTDDAEDGQVDPAQLFVCPMAEDNPDRQECRWYVDYQLGDGNVLGCDGTHSVVEPER
jgi:hypothetical protein